MIPDDERMVEIVSSMYEVLWGMILYVTFPGSKF